MVRRGFSRICRKIIGRGEKKEKVNPSASLLPLPVMISRGDARHFGPPASMHTTVPEFRPIVPEIPEILPIVLSSPSEAEYQPQSDGFTRPISPGSTIQNHADNDHFSTWPSQMGVDSYVVDAPAHSSEKKVDYNKDVFPSISRPPPRPMMSDASFYLLPEYTGSSDEEKWPCDIGHEVFEREEDRRQSISLSSSSSGWQQLAPIEPPSMDSTNDMNEYAVDFSPLNFTETDSADHHRSDTMTVARDVAYTQSGPSHARSPNSSTEQQELAQSRSTMQSSTPSVLLRKLKNSSDSVPHHLVPKRYSSLGATSVNGDFSSGLDDLISPERPKANFPDESVHAERMRGLNSGSSRASAFENNWTQRRNCHGPGYLAEDLRGMSHGGISLLPADPDASPLPMVSLPPSQLDRIFTSSSSDNIPRTPRIFLGNAAPRVPQVFRRDLLRTPPKSTFDPTDRLPRDYGVMNLRDGDMMIHHADESGSEGESTRSNTSQNELEMHVHSESVRHKCKQLKRDFDKFPAHEVALEGLPHPEEHISCANQSDNDTDRSSSENFLGRSGSNAQSEPAIDPYDRDGAQNRSILYDSE